MVIGSLYMANSKNNIHKKQNEKEMQSLVVAQHYVYREAKLWALVLFIISVLVPVSLNTSLIWITDEIIVGLMSFISILILFFSELIRSEISVLKENASIIQQKFDINVFSFKNNFNIDEDIVQHYLEKYKNKDWERKKNWYEKYDKLDKNKAIFYCQKENIDWTNSLSKKYTKFLVVLFLIMVILFILNLIFNNSSIIHTISILIVALPLLTYCYSGYIKIKNDNKLIARIENVTNGISVNIESDNQPTETSLVNLQWMIFFLRCNKYLVPDWFDRLFYKKIQSIEKRKSKQVNIQRTD